MVEPIVGGEASPSGARERAAELIGRVISDRYKILELVAMGGMGAIYRAEHVLMRKEVAIKILHPSIEGFPELVARFEREAVAGAHVQHPNVASASDFGKFDEDSYFLVLEFIRGRTLRQLLEQGPIAPERAASIAKQIAAGLGAAHEKGIVHRDVKPRNIMISDEKRGGEDVVKLIDFGLAKVPVEQLSTAAQDLDGTGRRSLTQAGVVMGTIAYMPPEAALGMRSVGPRSDLYALGVIFYEMLAGKHPFEATDNALLFAAHKKQPPPPMRERAPEVVVPAPLERVVMRLLAKDPDERYPDAAALIEAIDAALSRGPAGRSLPPAGTLSADAESAFGAPTGYAPTFAYAPPSSGRAAPRWLLAAGGGVALAVVLGVVVWLGRSAAPEPPSAASASAAASPSGTNEPPRPTPSPTAEAPPVVTARSSAAAAAPTASAAGEDGALRAAASAGDVDKGLEALRALAARDGVALSPSELADAVTLAEAAASSPSADATYQALATELGPAGLDVLYELVVRDLDRVTSGKAASANGPGARARQALGRPQALDKASPALRIAYELRSAGCERRTYLFARAAAEGDGRARAILEAMRPPTCGPQGGGCCQAHPELDKAIEALRAR